MGIGAQTLGLLHEMARAGELAGVQRVIEFGSQELHCVGYGPLVNRVVQEMGKTPFGEHELRSLINGGGAQTLYERLGWEYRCIDTDGRHGALPLDFNFDPMPAAEKGCYDLVTNFGTTEHLINQLNAFSGMHELVKPGGLMVHVLPFVGCVDHGFFTYQPNFFYALARFNSYEILGVWLNPNTSLSSLIPWQPGMLNYIHISPTTDSAIAVVLRKVYPVDFKVPFQHAYEATQIPASASRYEYVVDGEVLNGARIAHIQRSALGVQVGPPTAVALPTKRPFWRRVAGRILRLLLQ